ncbi:hypothetical protein [Lactobacillus delbrueckii]|uniref:hypothetical protein n=1 Tax=Lactobacillus delbrueckii TaxID=1584 RepID=UPI0037C50A63
MQISSENYINVLTEQIKALIVENMQLKAHILDMEATKAKEASDKKTEERGDESL